MKTIEAIGAIIFAFLAVVATVIGASKASFNIMEVGILFAIAGLCCFGFRLAAYASAAAAMMASVMGAGMTLRPLLNLGVDFAVVALILFIAGAITQLGRR